MNKTETGVIIDNMKLIRRGVWLAEQRERHPSYAMELQAVLQMCDDLIDRLNTLASSISPPNKDQ